MALRGPGFSTPQDDSQLSLMPDSGHLMPSCGLFEHYTHTVHRKTGRQNSYNKTKNTSFIFLKRAVFYLCPSFWGVPLLIPQLQKGITYSFKCTHTSFRLKSSLSLLPFPPQVDYFKSLDPWVLKLSSQTSRELKTFYFKGKMIPIKSQKSCIPYLSWSAQTVCLTQC